MFVYAYALSLLSLFSLVLAASPRESGTYTISPRKFPHLCLAPETPTNGAPLVLKNCDTSDDIVWQWSGQQWRNTASNKCVDIKDGGRWNGNKFQVWECFSYNTNQMYILPNAQIQWAGQNFCFDLTDGRGQVGTQIQQWNCFDHNDNQMWDFVDAEEVDECDGRSGLSSVPASALSTPTAVSPAAAASSASATPASMAASSGRSDSLPGNGLYVEVESSSSSRRRGAGSSSSSAAPASGAGAGTASPAATAAASSTRSQAPAASPSPAASNTGSSASLLRTRGTKVVDASNQEIILRGTNLGGYLVFEDWMCGISDSSGTGDRFPQWTLERRFGEAQTKALMNVWMDNWLVAEDFDRIASLGFNVVRLPFSYKNFIMNDGSDNDVGFTRIDWVVAQAKRVGIYVIPVFHIWDTQQERYSMISENNNDGQASRDRAGALWKRIAARYKNEGTIAAWDAINEPTGSWGDLLQRNLYDAIRSVDPNHIIIQASLSTNPSQYGWTNVIYTQHEYQMMGSDLGSNRAAYSAGPGASISAFNSLNIPTYIGEFMADSSTLEYMLQQLTGAGVWWSSWTLKTVQMDRWGLFNFGNGMSVNVGSDSYDSIRQKWSNMGGVTRQDVADIYQRYARGQGKRDVQPSAEREVERRDETPSPRVARAHAHAGRSRRQQRGHAVRAGVSF